jgi:hypothetical protein
MGPEQSSRKPGDGSVDPEPGGGSLGSNKRGARWFWDNKPRDEQYYTTKLGDKAGTYNIPALVAARKRHAAAFEGWTRHSVTSTEEILELSTDENILGKAERLYQFLQKETDFFKKYKALLPDETTFKQLSNVREIVRGDNQLIRFQREHGKWTRGNTKKIMETAEANRGELQRLCDCLSDSYNKILDEKASPTRADVKQEALVLEVYLQVSSKEQDIRETHDEGKQIVDIDITDWGHQKRKNHYDMLHQKNEVFRAFYREHPDALRLILERQQNIAESSVLTRATQFERIPDTEQFRDIKQDFDQSVSNLTKLTTAAKDLLESSTPDLTAMIKTFEDLTRTSARVNSLNNRLSKDEI